MTVNALTEFPDTFRKATTVVMAHSDGDEFTVLDRKVFNALLSKAFNRIPYSTKHRVALSDLAMVVSEDPARQMRLVESLKRLATVNVNISYTDANKVDHHIRCHYLSFHAQSINGGILEYAFDQIILEFLKEPLVYSKVKLSVSSRFKSSYGHQLYEVMQAHYNAFNKTWTPTVEELKRFFGVADRYEDRFDHFKRRCIERAVEEVNQHAEFQVAVDYRRTGTGGRVTAVAFKVMPKSMQQLAAVYDPAIPGKKVTDLDTKDLFTGASAREMMVMPVISQRVLEEVIALAGSEELAVRWRDDWFYKNGDKAHYNPDQGFLAYAKLSKSALDEETKLADIDVDAFFGDLVK